MNKWSSKDSLKVYNVPYWGSGFFNINAAGHVTAAPDKTRPDQSVVISDAVAALQAMGLSTPVLLRFPQILKSRLDAIFNAFNQAIEKSNYQGDYLCVYPIKVNQQQRVIETISQSYSDKPRLGLEAGSKPELLAVLSHHHAHGSVIVCNGYKDREYIRHALLGQLMGHKVYIVIEKPSELELVIDESKRLNIRPLLGVRAKLASTGSGMWESSGGSLSKFGLNASQILALVERLRGEEMLDCLQLQHFHLGSQIADIRDIQGGIRECGRFYAELRRLGANIQIVDVGGGLGVDYEGTRSQSHCSANYSLSEYANNVVWGVGDVCREFDLPHPTLISESGRALTAHHAVLVTNLIGAEAVTMHELSAPSDDAPNVLKTMWQGWLDLHGEDPSLLELYHDSQADLADSNAQYTLGLLNLEQRAWAEMLHQNTCYTIKGLLNPVNRNHRALADELSERLADKCFANFSLFQSLPDAWGIGQVFPVMPLSNLHKPLDRRAILLDITCDSDGQVEHYVDGLGVESTLPMPTFSEGETCHVGFFLVGAYQEILGDLHNLFGDTHCAEVWVDDDGQMAIKNVMRGDSVDQLLRYVNIDPAAIRARYQAIAAKLAPEARDALLAELERGLQGYTYLEDE
ncbi:MAG: biosynthetic arginine decarboxylase [Aeromonas sp.]